MPTLVGLAYHRDRNANAKVEGANGVIRDTLRAHANGRKDGWGGHLPLAQFAINTATSTLDAGPTPFFVDRGAHPRPPLARPRDDRAADSESPARRMPQAEATVRGPPAAAQAERKARLDAGRVDTVF